MILKDLLDFIRIKLSVSATLLPISGYLLFNDLSFGLFPVSLSAFFACVAVYSYNNITDMEEDLANKRKINPFSLNISGKLIVVISLLLSILSMFLLQQIPLLFYILFLISAMLYSFFRIKKYVLIKNIYTTISLSLLFLVGATNSQITSVIMPYYILISILLFAGSVTSDLKDYKGDLLANIRTIPVRIGHERTKKLIYLLLVIIIFSILTLRLYPLFIFLPFVISKIFFIKKNYFSLAHNIGGFSIISLTVLLFIISI